MKRIALRLDRLEDRLAPAAATWDGGGADNKWTTAANWVGDVAPQPGDDLVFPSSSSVPHHSNVNDFPAGTPFHSIDIGPNYVMTGNAVALAAGLNWSGSQIGFSVTLTGDQTFSGGRISGTIDVYGHALTLTGGSGIGPITGTGSLMISSGFGTVVLGGTSTFTGPTAVSGALHVTGTLPGPVTVVIPPSGHGTLSGTGAVGDVTVNDRLFPGELQLFEGGPQNGPGTLKTGNLSLASTAQTQFAFFRDLTDASVADGLAVTGTVQVGGRLILMKGFFDPEPRPGDRFTLISNDGTDPIVGTFVNVPEGGEVQSGNTRLRITYRGGDGNDMVATVLVQGPRSYAVGAGAGGLPIVNVYDAGSHLIRSFLAYASNFRGGVRVATADVTGDGVPDVITAPGPGGGPHIRVFDGVTFAVVKEFMAYDPLFTGGVFVAAARMDAQDGVAEIITGAGAGGGPHVKVFDGATGATTQSFFAYDGAFRGGVSVAGADAVTTFQGDVVTGKVVTGPGVGGGPDVRVFDGATGALTISFLAYDAAFRGGVNVAARGPLTYSLPFGVVTQGVIVTALASGGNFVNVISTGTSPIVGFPAYGSGFLAGVTVTVQAFTPDVITILTGTGPGAPPQINAYQVGIPSGKITLAGSIFAFDPAFLGGVFVG
jgi:hypothetical protein